MTGSMSLLATELAIATPIAANLSLGLVIGLVSGGVVVTILIVGVLVFRCRSGLRKKSSNPESGAFEKGLSDTREMSMPDTLRTKVESKHPSVMGGGTPELASLYL
jgi:hypothetical protein